MYKFQAEIRPVMTCYKVCTCEVNVFMLQTAVERFLQSVSKFLHSVLS